MDDILNASNGAQEPVVAAQGGEQTPANPTIETVDNGGQEPVVAAQGDGAGQNQPNPAQSREDNAAARAARLAERQRVERELKAENDRRVASYGLTDPQTGQPVTTQEQFDSLWRRAKAEQEGKTPEQIEMEEQERQRIAMLERENAELVAREHDRQLSSDLERLNAAFPELKAKAITDLDERYIALMAAAEAAGQKLDPVAAYAAINAQKKPVPPSMGSVSGSGAAEREFYTEAELDALTPAQLKDDKIYEKAVKSMDHWLKKKG